jgi:hypothetical protein
MQVRRTIGMAALLALELFLGAALIYMGWNEVVEQKRFMNKVSRQNYPFALRDIPLVAKRMLITDALIASWAVGWGVIASASALIIPRARIRLRPAIWFRIGLGALFGFHVWRFIVSDAPSRGRLGIELAGIGDDSGYAFFTHFTADIWLTALCACSVSLALVFVAEAVLNTCQALRAGLHVKGDAYPRERKDLSAGSLEGAGAMRE